MARISSVFCYNCEMRTIKLYIFTFILIGLLGICAASYYFLINRTHNYKDGSQAKSQPSNQTSFDKTKHSLDNPSSLWVVVNKQRPLHPQDFVPNDLVFPKVALRVPGNESMQIRKPVAIALEQMFSDAKKDGLKLRLSSGYRSYLYQVSLYNSYTASGSQQKADRVSARPGYSEHQTGLAADIEPESGKCTIQKCFANTPEGKWLAANVHKYGFIIRYATNKTSITGYVPEPWHIRYIGKDLALEMHNTDIETLEEFFGLPAAPGY
jgi:zinc D-Ala-D-Ala carboxypeptidase